MKRFLLLLVVVVFSAPVCYAKVSPSFDCSKASTEVEKMVCSDDELAQLDVEMDKSYKAFMDSLSEDFYKDKLKQQQLRWLSNRQELPCFKGSYTRFVSEKNWQYDSESERKPNEVVKKACLKNAYQVRVDNLDKWTRRENYDFFRDYIGIENSGVVFIDSNGEEFSLTCYDLLYPYFPKDTLLYSSFRQAGPYAPSPLYVHYEDEKIYVYCFISSPETDFVQPKEFDSTDFDPKDAPKSFESHYNFDEGAFNILVEMLVKNITPITKSPNGDMIWEKIKSEGISELKPMVVKSFEELKDKADVKCSREQFESLIDSEHKEVLAEPYLFYKLPGKYSILRSNNFFAYGKSKGADYYLKKLCLLNMETCHCDKVKDENYRGLFEHSAVVKIGNEYFVSYLHKDFCNRQFTLSHLNFEEDNALWVDTIYNYRLNQKECAKLDVLRYLK